MAASLRRRADKIVADQIATSNGVHFGDAGKILIKPEEKAIIKGLEHGVEKENEKEIVRQSGKIEEKQAINTFEESATNATKSVEKTTADHQRFEFNLMMYAMLSLTEVDLLVLRKARELN